MKENVKYSLDCKELKREIHIFIINNSEIKISLRAMSKLINNNRFY